MKRDLTTRTTVLVFLLLGSSEVVAEKPDKASETSADLATAIDRYAARQQSWFAGELQQADEYSPTASAHPLTLNLNPQNSSTESQDAPIFACAFPPVMLQESDAPTSQPASTPTATTAPARSPEKDIWHRDKLTGDWFGARTELADHGINIDLRLTQYYQGVAYGGANTNFAYGGILDYIFNFDGHKMGLWEGLFITMHAQTQFGESINGDAGALSLPNTSMLFPLPGKHETAITGLQVMQALSKNFAITAGKFNFTDLWTMLYPRTGGAIDGFTNTNMLLPAMPFFRWVNLSFLGVGALVLTDDEQVQGAILVIDTNNATTTTGIPELFDSGAGILGLWRFFFDIDDKPGRLMFMGGGSTRDYASLENSSWASLNFSDLIVQGAPTKSGVWTASVLYDQVLWQNPTNPKQDLWFYTGWSIGDGDPSFSKWAGMASLEATGVLFNREHDRAGVGAFYGGLSSDFKSLAGNAGLDLRDTWGTELYYNAEITPWFHVTGDLQVVQNQNDSDDPAIILGLRAVIDL